MLLRGALLLLAAGLLRVAAAQTMDATGSPVAPVVPVAVAAAAATPVTVIPVLYVYQTLTHQQKIEQVCWPTLVTEHQMMLQEEQAKPWLWRNAVPLVGVAMGVAGGSYLLRRHASAQNIQRGMIPAMLGGGLFGLAFGPAGVIGGFAGGLLGDRFGKHKFPIVLASGLLGAATGKKLWDLVFPPLAALDDASDDPGVVALETFLRQQSCAATLDVSYDAPQYRVTYRVGDDEYETDLPYDPGEALLLDAQGRILGPARGRTF